MNVPKSIASNPIYILNCGGLCNRLNNFINGAYLSSVLKRRLVIFWPINQACYCRFDELFQNNLDIEYLVEWEPETVTDYTGLLGSDCVFYKKNWKSEVLREQPGYRFKTYDGCQGRKRFLHEVEGHQHGTLLQGGVLFDFIPAGHRLSILAGLQPVEEIQQKVNKFVVENQLDKKTIGMHIRRTDAPSINDNYFISRIQSHLSKNPRSVFFVCSDSTEVERQLKKKFKDNLITNPKKEYPVKMHSKGRWVTGADGTGKYNVWRSKEAVKEAVIDLYLLAHTKFLVRSLGSFSNTGYYLSLIQKFEGGENIGLLTCLKVKHYTRYQRLVLKFDRIRGRFGC